MYEIADTNAYPLSAEQRGRLVYPFGAMKIGQSFSVPPEKIGSRAERGWTVESAASGVELRDPYGGWRVYQNMAHGLIYSSSP